MIAVSAVVWKLKSVNAITAIVSTRIYPGRAPQGAALPYIIVDNPPGQQNIGQTGQGSGNLRKTPLMVMCFSDKDTGGLKQAGEISALVEVALAPVSGVTGSVQWNGTWIDHTTLGESYQHIEDPQEGDEVGWRSMAVPVTVFHMNC